MMPQHKREKSGLTVRSFFFVVPLGYSQNLCNEQISFRAQIKGLSAARCRGTTKPATWRRLSKRVPRRRAAGYQCSVTRGLQLAQNAAARILTKTTRIDHITPVLIYLHWLPITVRADFKIILLTFRSLNGLAPLMDYHHVMVPFHNLY